MSDVQRKSIVIPEITRIEGHAAVYVDIADGAISDVKLNVFEGPRFFERIVVGHSFTEIPHITSRVCAICSTGHVLAAVFALEKIAGFSASKTLRLYRELMHLGMIIESHATHIYALAMPDFLGAKDLLDFAGNHAEHFQDWNKLRSLGNQIQSCVGGRSFHPVNLQVGGLSRYPAAEQLRELLPNVSASLPTAIKTCEFLLSLKPSVSRTTTPNFMALIPDTSSYGYFGNHVRSSSGWERTIQEYRKYLNERAVSFSHAKRTIPEGPPVMVGSMARLHLFGDRLQPTAKALLSRSPMANGDTNTVWNNLAQAIEIVEAIQRVQNIIAELIPMNGKCDDRPLHPSSLPGGSAAGAIECPRGTLYHWYELDAAGAVVHADMITPSVQNTVRIELDVREVVQQYLDEPGRSEGRGLEAELETMVRAYDPCNTCATHMVSVSGL
jgi:sulfhydrogenase subunit alpha